MRKLSSSERRAFSQLQKFARGLGVKVQRLAQPEFRKKFPPGVLSVYDPSKESIYIISSLGGDVLSFAFAHELGHVIDHRKDPEGAAEYGYYFHLAQICRRRNIDLSTKAKKVFLRHEKKANFYGDVILRKLSLEVSRDVRERFSH